jgi:hypothetical protein
MVLALINAHSDVSTDDNALVIALWILLTHHYDQSNTRRAWRCCRR